MKLNTLAPPPSMSRFSDITVAEDNSTSPLSLTLGDPSSTVAATSSSSSLVSSTGMSFGGTGANRTFTITPQANASGSNAMITVAATSPDGGVGVEWFYLTVNPVNDAPIFSSVADRAINPGVSLAIPASATDVEGAGLGYALVSGPAGCSVNPSTGTFNMEADDRPVRRHLSCSHPRHGKRNRRIEFHPQFPDDREPRDRSASFHVVDPRGRTIISASSTLHEWPAWPRLPCMGFGRSNELGQSWYGNTHNLPLRMDRCECLAVSEAFLSDSTRAVGRDEYPYSSMLVTDR